MKRQKALLHDIFRLRGRRRQTVGKAERRYAMPRIKRQEGRLVAGPGPREQTRVRLFHILIYCRNGRKGYARPREDPRRRQKNDSSPRSLRLCERNRRSELFESRMG
jgi:hypothetical protein